MEIGTDQGGTFVCWSRLAGMEGLKISLDLANGPWGRTFDVVKRNSYLTTLGNTVSIINGDSHKESSYMEVKQTIGEEKLDFLFIDGDHSYIGVKLDYHMYRHFVKPGGWIGFHDIKNTDYHHKSNCFVDVFWEELTNEKVWFMDQSDWGGIGFVKV